MITHSRLLELLRYDPETGEFYRTETGARVGYFVPAGIRSSPSWRVSVGRVSHRRGRLAWFYMTGNWPNEIDHINRDGTDDRWSNLRNATRSQNEANKGPRKNNKLGVKGVTLNGGAYAVHIMKGGEKTYIGRFRTLRGASLVYQHEASKIYGDFATTALDAAW